jgi:hypothetical protein
MGMQMQNYRSCSESFLRKLATHFGYDDQTVVDYRKQAKEEVKDAHFAMKT